MSDSHKAAAAIDFVVLFLDNQDPEWQRQYHAYATPQEGEEQSEVRFRDWGWLRYWLRSVAQYAPWVHRLFIISVNARPEWLHPDDEHLRWVNHTEFIPAEMLPTFNSNTIELNLHRIPDLSEHFVLFNDDFFLNAPVTPEDYFRKGWPVDAPLESFVYAPRLLNNDWGTQIMEYCNVALLNRNFQRTEVVKHNLWGWFGLYMPLKFILNAIFVSFNKRRFITFFIPHVEKPFLKSVCAEVWQKEAAYLTESCTRFRQPMNANIYLMRLWHLASNKFVPSTRRLQGGYYEILPQTLPAIEADIMQGKNKSLCLNDTPACSTEFFPVARQRILAAFAKKYTCPCAYEK